jgi:hypothetical protein
MNETQIQEQLAQLAEVTAPAIVPEVAPEGEVLVQTAEDTGAEDQALIEQV